MTMQTWGSSGGTRAPMNWGSPNYLDFGLTNESVYQGGMPAGMQFMPDLPQVNVGPSAGSGAGSSMFGDLGKSIGGWMNDSGFLGKKMANGDQVQGWGMPVIGAAQGLASAYLGYKTLGLEKDKLNENKRQFEMNWGAQQKMTNSRLEDRQRARIASNSNAYQSVGDYMKKNGI